MKKAGFLTIALAVSALLNVGLIAYAVIQNRQTEKVLQYAEAFKSMSEEAEARALSAMREAEMQRRIAERHLELAIESEPEAVKLLEAKKRKSINP